MPERESELHRIVLRLAYPAKRQKLDLIDAFMSIDYHFKSVRIFLAVVNGRDYDLTDRRRNILFIKISKNFQVYQLN